MRSQYYKHRLLIRPHQPNRPLHAIQAMSSSSFEKLRSSAKKWSCLFRYYKANPNFRSDSGQFLDPRSRCSAVTGNACCPQVLWGVLRLFFNLSITIVLRLLICKHLEEPKIALCWQFQPVLIRVLSDVVRVRNFAWFKLDVFKTLVWEKLFMMYNQQR